MPRDVIAAPPLVVMVAPSVAEVMSIVETVGVVNVGGTDAVVVLVLVVLVLVVLVLVVLVLVVLVVVVDVVLVVVVLVVDELLVVVLTSS